MSDLVPIGTHPGSVSGLVGQDLVLAPAATVRYTVDKLWIRTTDSTTDALVASIRNATGGGGDGLACTIAGAADDGVSTGSAITVEVGEKLYLRVASGNALRQNLSGHFERGGAPAVTTLLTTLALVKQFWGITGSADDDLLNNLNAYVSREIEDFLARRIVQATITGERATAPIPDHRLLLDHRPIVSIASLTEDGTALVEDTDFEMKAADKEMGAVVRISSGEPISWNSGLRKVLVTYDHGYAAIPAPLTLLATKLVTFDYLQSKPGQGRLDLRGKILEPGGDAQYKTRGEIWDDHRRGLAQYRSMG